MINLFDSLGKFDKSNLGKDFVERKIFITMYENHKNKYASDYRYCERQKT